MRHGFRVFFAVCAFLGVAGSQTSAQENSADWSSVVEAAKREGRLTVYSNALPEQVERVIRQFNKTYPEISVAHSRGSGELAVRVSNEVAARNDGADIFIFSDPLWFKVNEASVVSLNSPAADAYPENGWFITNKAPLVTYQTLGILVWNTDRLPNGLKTYQDLLDPALAGHIGTREQMTATLAAYLDFLEAELGPAYLKAFGRQRPQFYTSAVPMMQSLAAGEIWAANLGALGTIRDLQEQGAPIDWAIPEPRGFSNPYAAGVISVSQRPNAARVLMDFLLTPEGQMALNGDEAASPIPGITSLDLSRFATMDASKYTEEVRAEWSRKFEDYFR